MLLQQHCYCCCSSTATDSGHLRCVAVYMDERFLAFYGLCCFISKG